MGHQAVFPDYKVNDAHTMMDLGSRVSRKKDYIPEITKAVRLSGRMEEACEAWGKYGQYGSSG